MNANLTSEKEIGKVVVIGGSGLIGGKLVGRLRQRGREVLAASPSLGVNSVTGEGLAGALAGADVVVDVSNAPLWEDAAVLAFFEASTRNLLAAAKAAGVRHYVALSVVGTDRLQASGYFRAKLAQERLIEAGGIPFTIARATQFFEFAAGIVQASTRDDAVHLSTALMQPIAADDVAAALAEIATESPANGIVEIAGPEPMRMDAFVGEFLRASGDPRAISVDAEGYFGTPVDDRSLTPGAGARLGTTRFGDWLARAAGRK
jgi:uncharacterized protein YbjT (DUF2867 family)